MRKIDAMDIASGFLYLRKIFVSNNLDIWQNKNWREEIFVNIVSLGELDGLDWKGEIIKNQNNKNFEWKSSSEMDN